MARRAAGLRSRHFGGPARRRVQLARRVVAIDARQPAATHRGRLDSDVDTAGAQPLDEQALRGGQLVESNQPQRRRHRPGAERQRREVRVDRAMLGEPARVAADPAREAACLGCLLLVERRDRNPVGLHRAPRPIRRARQTDRRQHAALDRVVLDQLSPDQRGGLRTEQATRRHARLTLDPALAFDPRLPGQDFEGPPHRETLRLTVRVVIDAKLVRQPSSRREQQRPGLRRNRSHACYISDISRLGDKYKQTD